MTDDKRTKQVRQWRSARMERFAQIQLRKREWLNFEEVAVLCSELDGSGVPNKAAHENANRNLEHDLLSRDFEENGRSRVLFLHPSTAKTRMTPEWLQDAIHYNYDGHQGRSQFLPWCWFTRAMYERFAAKHNLPIAPPRFRPKHLATVEVAQPPASENLPSSPPRVQPEHTATVEAAQPPASENLPSSPPRVQPEHTATVEVAQPPASEKPPKAISQRRRPAEEKIRQELKKKAPEYIDTPGDETCWSIAGRLVETRGSARQLELDKTSKALKRYYDNRRNDRPPQD